MANAPRPGARRKAEDTAKAVKLEWVITVEGQEYRLRRGDLGPADTRLVRQQAGIRLLDIMAEVGGLDFDHVTVLWWLARRHAGESDLTYLQTEAEMPGYEDALGGGVTIRVEVLDEANEADGSPEA